MWKRLHVKYPLFLSDFNETWIFSTDFREKLKYQMSSKSIQWEPSCSTRAHRRTDTTKLIVAFRNFANVSKNKYSCRSGGPDVYQLFEMRKRTRPDHLLVLLCFISHQGVYSQAGGVGTTFPQDWLLHCATVWPCKMALSLPLSPVMRALTVMTGCNVRDRN